MRQFIFPTAVLLLNQAVTFIHSIEFEDPDTKVYALYFPQFHSDKLNNDLWGEGFTDWDNLRAAPKLNRLGQTLPYPTELGYYNLMDYDVRKKQATLAKEYGVDGFIYHHYYFYHEGQGASLADTVEKLLDSNDGEPNLPFAFNWAKATWETTWQGQFVPKNAPINGTILMEQLNPEPSDPRIIEHYNYLRKFFHHPNYITVHGAPLFSVYGPDTNNPPSLAIIQRLRELAIADGFPKPGLHVPMMRKMTTHTMYKIDAPEARMKHILWSQSVHDRILQNYDGLMHYPFHDGPPRLMRIPDECKAGTRQPASVRVHHNLDRFILTEVPPPGVTLGAPMPSYLGVVSVFDNTPRRNFEDAAIYDRNFSSTMTPAQSFTLDILSALVYDRCCQLEELRDMGGKFITLNAWNEWGEAMALEPSDKYGRSLLEAIQEAKRTAKDVQCDWQKYDFYWTSHQK